MPHYRVSVEEPKSEPTCIGKPGNYRFEPPGETLHKLLLAGWKFKAGVLPCGIILVDYPVYLCRQRGDSLTTSGASAYYRHA